MAGRVDHVQLVGLAVAGLVAQRHALRLDRDAALALQVHGVEHLLLHLAGFQAAAQLDEAVGQRGLAVIDVRDDGKVTDQLHQGAGGLGRRRIIAGRSSCRSGFSPTGVRLGLTHEESG